MSRSKKPPGKKSRSKQSPGKKPRPTKSQRTKQQAKQSRRPARPRTVTFLAWCDEVERVLLGSAFGAPKLPAVGAGPSNDVEIVRALQLLETTLAHKSEHGDRLLSDVLATVRRGNRDQIRAREAAVVALLAPYANSDDALIMLAWLDTEASLRPLVTELTSSFHRRERVGFGAILGHVQRDTSHAAVLFPALAAPVERAMAKQLLWDEWHLEALEGIAKLANELAVAPFSSCHQEIRMIVAGGDRVSAPVSKSLRLELGKVLAGLPPAS